MTSDPDEAAVDREGSSSPPSDDFQPSPDALTDVSSRPQMTNGRARCTRIAVCDDSGQRMDRFTQGERAHFFSEFEILDDISVPFGAIEITNQDSILVYGKASYQVGTELPPPLHAGDRITFHWALELRVAPGDYRFTVHLAETDADSFHGYNDGPMTYREFSRSVRKHSRLESAGSFEVTWAPGEKLAHHGMADLPARASFDIRNGSSEQRAAPPAALDVGANLLPTVLHITHWKAGSQWIYKILRQCCPDLVETPEGDLGRRPLVQGRLYPTVYMSRQEVDRLVSRDRSRRFIVIRDLRDTLVSAYFSFKLSHPIIPGFSIKMRKILQTVDAEDGLIYLMDDFLQKCAAIQLSWLEGENELLVRYEDLLTNDQALLESALIDHCGLPVTREKLRKAVLAARFEKLTGGRTRGHEDLTAHERKGVSGDWRNHFTEKVKRAFKARYGGLLVASGYEADLSW